MGASGGGSSIALEERKSFFPWAYTPPSASRKPVGSVTAPELLEALRRIEARGAVETAHRTLQNCGQVFRYAIATGRAERDPAADLRGALSPIKHISFASITESKEIGALLRDIDSYQGNIIVCAALLLPE